jgi:hypothetical protein
MQKSLAILPIALLFSIQNVMAQITPSAESQQRKQPANAAAAENTSKAQWKRLRRMTGRVSCDDVQDNSGLKTPNGTLGPKALARVPSAAWDLNLTQLAGSGWYGSGRSTDDPVDAHDEERARWGAFMYKLHMTMFTALSETQVPIGKTKLLLHIDRNRLSVVPEVVETTNLEQQKVLGDTIVTMLSGSQYLKFPANPKMDTLTLGVCLVGKSSATFKPWYERKDEVSFYSHMTPANEKLVSVHIGWPYAFAQTSAGKAYLQQFRAQR